MTVPTIHKDYCSDFKEIERQKKIANLKEQKENLNRLTKGKRKR
jgi:hypothetical protein